MIIPARIEVASIGMWDSLILMVMALVVFGPRRLPQLARQMGKLMYEFRKASNDFKFQMEEELRLSEEADRRRKAEELPHTLTVPTAETVPAEPPATESAPSATPDGELPPPNADPSPIADTAESTEEEKTVENTPASSEEHHG